MIRQISIIIGIVIFIIVLCATYILLDTNSNDNSSNNEISNIKVIEEIIYNGKLPIPVENFIQVTSKFGLRNAYGVEIGRAHV